MIEEILPGEAVQPSSMVAVEVFSTEGWGRDPVITLEVSDPETTDTEAMTFEAAGPETNAAEATQTAASPTTGALQNVTTFFYAWDHLGTIRLVSNQDRSVMERHDYEPFGVELRPILNQAQNTHQFTGHERDQASECDYMHARYYGGNLGRFMKPDIISGKPLNPQSFNLYAYVGGNPVNRNDPMGLDWFQVDGKWQWRKDKGSYTYTDANGKQQTAKGYAYLMVVTLQSVDKNGVSHYSVNLYYQNEKKPVASGTAFSGGAPKKDGGQYSSIPDGNYTINATPDMHHPAPTQQNPQSADNNPMPDYGIQPVPDSSSNGYLHAVWEAYGPMRARLNPMSPGMADSFYFHGQQPDANHAGSTSGCLSYGTDDTVISAIWNTNSTVPVSIDTPVVMP
jgi:RHS repeat-associated protein